MIQLKKKEGKGCNRNKSDSNNNKLPLKGKNKNKKLMSHKLIKSRKIERVLLPIKLGTKRLIQNKIPTIKIT